jgi:hypothetical protein
MITKIQIIILILSLADISASFLYVNQFHNKYPEQDPTIIEANPILKFSIKQFGIKLGMIFGGIIVFGIMLLVVLNVKPNMHYYLAGVLTMMCIYHFLNFKLLRMGA